MKDIPRKPFLYVFITIFIISFVYSLIYQIKIGGDAEAYDEIAVNLVNNHEYRASYNQPLENDGSISRIGPGYEMFVAGHYLLFGRHFWIIWFSQAILYALTIIMLGIIALRLFPALKSNLKLVYAVMIFFGLYIDAIQLNGMLMTESLFIFTLVLCFFYWYHMSNKWHSWIMLGSLLGLLTLIRPTGLIIFLLLSLVTIYKYKFEGIKYAIIVGMMFALIQFPWIVRNYNVYGRIIFHSTADGMNILSGNYPGNHGEFNADFPLFVELKRKYSSPVDFNAAAKAWYKNFVIHHPIQASGILLEKVIVLFSLAKTSGFWFHYSGKLDQIPTILLSILENFIILTSILFYLISLIPKIKSREINSREIFVLFAFIILIMTPILSVIANRHRLPLTIMSLPIVIYSIDYLIKNYKLNYRKILLAILIIAISTSIDVYLQFGKLKSRLHRVDKTEQHA